MKDFQNLKEPVRLACALRYDPEKNRAPVMTAGGRGEIAEKIIALAREAGVPLQENPELVGILSRLDVGAEIPPELYRAVAEILAFLYTLNEDQRLKKP
ncbi:MAG: EscU/YscU/HrcU family type III secretion system export apparatus switch protein [Deltaproteobacteria bacterium]